MEKTCEFCKALSPIVYCKSDAAHLCLSCDAKVHSANALSYRHPRTLVCESCRYRPAKVRCVVHEKFMCESCETSHCFSFRHETKAVSCYVGCPSAKELAALWGFDLNELDNERFDDDHSAAADYRGPSNRGTKVVKDDNLQQRSCLILQQILDLERLQLSEGIDGSCLIHVKERTGGSPFKVHTTLDTHIEHLGGQLEFQHMGSPREKRTEEPLSSPFSQMDHLTSSGNPLQGDSFWQCKSPVYNNEIWLQNMQDLGVCDEVQCFEDVNIPDVDLTFRNFEEIFGNEHESTRAQADEENTTCSFADDNPPFGKLDRGRATTIEDISGPSLVCVWQQSDDVGKYIDSSDQVHQLETFDYHPRPIRLSYSASSFSVSRITGESNGSEYRDDELELSPTFPKQILPHGSYDSENTKLDGKENVIMRYKEKKVLRFKSMFSHFNPYMWRHLPIKLSRTDRYAYSSSKVRIGRVNPMNHKA
ncbi:hypothetical protein BUALT_Bualt05G0120400 [Buddleja alternifolia]|uniref:B box-type domain-containing protein n=1 Tax=Buddleja alternifolia TaxID=168488 RepID=A0AAV6XQA5_9LAMI|nr:hypothetical protein BUALT_Bualt05G0120400 [Buddleja alternifolia]